jgi:hypothetical protein
MSTGFATEAEGERWRASAARRVAEGNGSSRCCRDAASAATIPGPPEFVKMARCGPSSRSPEENTFAIRKRSPIESARKTPDCSKRAS